MEREAGPEKVAQFIKEIPDEIVKFDNFTVLEELSNNQIDQKYNKNITSYHNTLSNNYLSTKNKYTNINYHIILNNKISLHTF